MNVPILWDVSERSLLFLRDAKENVDWPKVESNPCLPDAEKFVPSCDALRYVRLIHKSIWNIDEILRHLLLGGVFLGQNGLGRTSLTCFVVTSRYSHSEVTDYPKWVLSWFYHLLHNMLGFWLEQTTTAFSYISPVSLFFFVFACHFWKCVTSPDDNYTLVM